MFRSKFNSKWFLTFKVYAARNAEVLTCHEVQVREISIQQSWVEVDPLEIWQNVLECIQVAIQNLVILDINPDDICALALTNRRETTVLWHKITGRPLYNAIGKMKKKIKYFIQLHLIICISSNSME